VLVELHVADLGVIEDLTLPLSEGLVALTGETGAGKTLIVEAIDLLVGGRADPGRVRQGADEAVVDGRFELDGEEVVVSRVVPASGRSRAYVDGRPATVAMLAELGRRSIDLHGQHDHQSLLRTSVQRRALDHFGDVDLRPLEAARTELREIDEAIEALGGDEQQRARELDLVRYELAELDDAGLDDPDEAEALAAREALLASATELRATGGSAAEHLGAEGGPRDQIARATAMLEDSEPFASLASRLAGAVAELDEIVSELRSAASDIDEDPAALAAVQERQRVLQALRRKFGPSLADVIESRERARRRLAELEHHDDAVAALGERRAEVLAALSAAEHDVRDARCAAASPLARAVERRLRDLAMPHARLVVTVGDDRAGDDVRLELSANPGSAPQPLAKVASGGELARAMLALRLELSDAPDTLVFDEVDAGIGGEAAVTVGRALAELGERHQVLVVTHLAQVAAPARLHLAVAKTVADGTTVTSVKALSGSEREVEVARMLSGSPDSTTARRHARELLTVR
jgi:DNA repair protein RecN (Recombination protein N)